jgi:membrane dipeptidase
MIFSEQRQDPPGLYPFGLSVEEEARAKALHRDAIVVDLLSQRAGANIFAAYPQDVQQDLKAISERPGSVVQQVYDYIRWPYELSRTGRSDLIADWYRQAGLDVICHNVPVEDYAEAYHAEMNRPYEALPWLRFVTNAAEMRQAKRDGVIATFGNCQVDGPIAGLAGLNRAYGLGLRSFMLTYNSMTNIGVGCTERVDAGLSRFGVEVVEHCNAIGVIVDTSHCGPATTLDACRASKRPVTANHTAAKGVFDHARGKSDECLRAIADTGGLIGIVTVPAFLTDQAAPTIEVMLDHIGYVADLVGWEHVAIGTDWPLQAPLELLQPLLAPSNKDLAFRPEDRLDPAVNMRGFEDCRDMPNITRGLVKRGWTDEAIRGVLGENALRVFEANEGAGV